MRVACATQAARSATPSRAEHRRRGVGGCTRRRGLARARPRRRRPAAPRALFRAPVGQRFGAACGDILVVCHEAGGGGLAAVAMGCVAAVADAQPSGFPLVSGDPLTAFRVSSSRAASSVVDVEGPGFSRAFRIDVHEPGENWDVELGARLGRAVNRGEVAFITFQARAIRGRRRHRRGLLHRLRAEGVAGLGQVAARRAGGRRRLAGLHAAVLLGRGLRRHPGQLRLRRRRVLAGHRDRRHPGDRLRAGRHPRHAAGGAVHLRRARPPTIRGAPKPRPGSTRSGRAISSSRSSTTNARAWRTPRSASSSGVMPSRSAPRCRRPG